MSSNTLSGYIGEQYVKYRLLSFGFEVIDVNANYPYDLIAFSDGPVRIQVKSTSRASSRISSYKFSTGQGSHHNLYKRGAFDILALFSHKDERAVFYPQLPNKYKRIKRNLFVSEVEKRSWFLALNKCKL